MGTRIEKDSYYSNPLGYIRGLFAQTANSIPITNTAVETTLLDGGVGSLTIPPDAFQIGDSFVASLGGIISCGNNDTLQIRVKTGSVILGNTGVITMPQCTNQHWDFQIRFTIRSLGGPGVASIASFGQFTYSKDAANVFEGADFSLVENTNFDTTVGNTLEITAQWGSADIQDVIYSENFILTKIF